MKKLICILMALLVLMNVTISNASTRGARSTHNRADITFTATPILDDEELEERLLQGINEYGKDIDVNVDLKSILDDATDSPEDFKAEVVDVKSTIQKIASYADDTSESSEYIACSAVDVLISEKEVSTVTRNLDGHYVSDEDAGYTIRVYVFCHFEEKTVSGNTFRKSYLTQGKIQILDSSWTPYELIIEENKMGEAYYDNCTTIYQTARNDNDDVTYYYPGTSYKDLEDTPDYFYLVNVVSQIHCIVTGTAMRGGSSVTVEVEWFVIE